VDLGKQQVGFIASKQENVEAAPGGDHRGEQAGDAKPDCQPIAGGCVP